MEETTIENLAQDMRQLRSMIATHINNPFGHPTADATTIDKIGFANAYGFVEKSQIAQALGVPKYIADDTNVLSLKPGYYKCYKPAGLPNDIATQGRVWIIDVNYPLDSKDLGLITVLNDLGSKFVAVRNYQGDWHWLRYGDQLKFGSDLADGGSRYTVLHLENKLQVHVHADLDVTIAPQSVKLFGTGYPGSLWRREWQSGKVEDALYVSGIGKAGGMYLPIQAWFGPSLTIANPNNHTIDHVSADFRYELEKY